MLHFTFGLGSFLDSIEHDFIGVWKSETGKEWQIGWVGKAFGIVSLIPTGAKLYFAETLKPCCQFCTNMPEMSDLCYLGKTRMRITEELRPKPSLSLYNSLYSYTVCDV